MVCSLNFKHIILNDTTYIKLPTCWPGDFRSSALRINYYSVAPFVTICSKYFTENNINDICEEIAIKFRELLYFELNLKRKKPIH